MYDLAELQHVVVWERISKIRTLNPHVKLIGYFFPQPFKKKRSSLNMWTVQQQQHQQRMHSSTTTTTTTCGQFNNNYMWTVQQQQQQQRVDCSWHDSNKFKMTIILSRQITKCSKCHKLFHTKKTKKKNNFITCCMLVMPKTAKSLKISSKLKILKISWSGGEAKAQPMYCFCIFF